MRRAKGYTPNVEFSPQDATRTDADFLWCCLPSGRVISYASPICGWRTKYFDEDGQLVTLKDVQAMAPEREDVVYRPFVDPARDKLTGPQLMTAERITDGDLPPRGQAGSKGTAD